MNQRILHIEPNRNGNYIQPVPLYGNDYTQNYSLNNQTQVSIYTNANLSNNIEKDDIAFALNAKGNAADAMREVARSAALVGLEKKKSKCETDIKSTQEILEFVRLMKHGDESVKPFAQNFKKAALAQDFEECKYICNAYMNNLLVVVGNIQSLDRINHNQSDNKLIENYNPKDKVNSHKKTKSNNDNLFF